MVSGGEMAKPRVFISSTYYDLKSVRADLERFIRDRGYDPVLNERGHVTYSKETSPEISCYREIENCDILISIIGGRFGSDSHQTDYSISQLELRTALEQYKQVYIFVQSDVLTEYRTYFKNKDAKIEWAAADDVKIYRFLDEVFSLETNNATMPFETGGDIIALLREQWSGLFQRLLQNSTALSSFDVAKELRQGVESARQLVELLRSSNEKGEEDASIKAILQPNHPAFSRIRKVLKVPYRVYFTTLEELNAWLHVRNFREVVNTAWDSKNYAEWYFNKDGSNWDLLKISSTLFDDNDRFNPENVEWSDSLIKREIRPRALEERDDGGDADDDDDLPF